MKKVKWIFFGIFIALLVVFLGGYLFIKWNKTTSVDPHHLIPSNAMYVFESDKPLENWEQLQKNELWNFLNKHPYFDAINKDAAYLDTLINEQKSLLKLFGRRKFICSAHPLSKTKYDFLFAVDLAQGRNIMSSPDVLANLLEEAGFKLTSRKSGDYDILSCKDPYSGDVLYMVLIHNYLVCSYAVEIVENSIKAYHDPEIAKDENFQKVYKKINANGYGRLWVQWSWMDDYFAMYSSQPNPWLNEITQAMSYGAFDLYLQSDQIKLDGNIHPFDSFSGYLQALVKSGSNKAYSSHVLSNRTAFSWTMCFKSMDKFYENLKEVALAEPKTAEKFNKNLDRVQNYLNINVEEDLIAWMGEEVCFAQNKRFSNNSKDEYIALIKIRNRELAQKKLGFLTEQIKKKTPTKFKELHFRSYTIHYLELKGAFNFLFGDLFQKMEKPYFTFVEDYVVFSNSARGLIGLIEDFENNRVLEADPNYISSGDESTMLSVYVAPYNTFEALKSKLKFEKAEDLKKSKEYFEGFGAFSLDLRSAGKLVKVEANLTMRKEDSTEQIGAGDIASLWKQQVESGTDEQFALRIIEDGIYKQFYPGSDQVFIDAKTKWGIMHGKYTEYHQNGQVKCRGKYRKGQKTGVWKYYNDQGEQVDKKRF